MKKFSDYFRGETAPAEEAEAPLTGNTILIPDGVPTRSGIEKIDFHISRFTRAIEQCEKGPDRIAELQGHLDYWTARRDLETSREGMK